MEDENNKKIKHNFTFLENSDVQEHFADLNIELLSGRHIQKDRFYLYKLLKDYYNELSFYYEKLYGLELIIETRENSKYYYVDYPEDSKGALSHTSRHKKLTPKQTLVGIILLNMYYEKYFENKKEVRFVDIKKEIKESDNNILYKKLFFNKVQDDYTEGDWSIKVIKPFKSVLRDFNKLGWITNLGIEDGEEIHFELREPIIRFQKLYEDEITNFTQFSEKYLSQIQ
ncbi:MULTISPECIES: condensin complex protein MksE [Winogradskyella]|jgi:chromosome condensin MukBEF MukE localization factor|uniref:DUF4194 domain-containing protein n=2 Tax=Winogradskyella TaxID=286104 RepID=A0ABT7ZUS0_9FLAO|nr:MULTISPECIES: hypothetical protein [Winogradskyella]MBC3844961.1 hypothetical protein [Winogradskyella echinorum]MBC5749309.1 hypothetical protein [Winogradskyella echinorum]MDN3492784.1 hypothetical protein [Winogradskyella bathintestinalis]